MSSIIAEAVRIPVGNATVSGLLTTRARAGACFVFGHGAGAGMTHPFMTRIASGLAERGIATLRYQFPYMESGAKRPDALPLATAAVRAAVAEAHGRRPDLLLIAGGKSFGGRMTSQAQALTPLEHVRGLVFFGFPLHPAGRPATERAKHLFDVAVPMLFLQGTRDALARLDLLEEVCWRLGSRASLVRVEDADHSFRVPAKSRRTDSEVCTFLLDAFEAWAKTMLGWMKNAGR